MKEAFPNASRRPCDQLTLLVDGSIAQDLVRDDPSMARAAKQAAAVLLANAGVEIGADAAAKPKPTTDRRPPSSS